MSSPRTRLFQTESFRLAAIYAGLFFGSMAMLIMLIYFIVAQAFEGRSAGGSDDDLAAIQRAYQENSDKRPNRAIHEAKEMIDDRLMAADMADAFLMQKGCGYRVAGNLPTMTPRAGSCGSAIRSWRRRRAGEHVILGRGEFLTPDLYAFVGRDLHAAEEAETTCCAPSAGDGREPFGGVGGGLLLSRSFLRRVDAITGTCRAIMAGRLDERIAMRGTRDELDRLAATINDMLDRIGMLMESLRQVSNDIAHDLRTPLAHLRYRLERARLEAKSSEDYATAVDAAIAESDQLLAMFAALLRIAQIEAGARHAGMEEVELVRLVGRGR